MSCIPFDIQVQDPNTEEWADLLHLHALQVNTTGGGEATNAGAEWFHLRRTFDVRWSKVLEDVIRNPQVHRIVYQGQPYNIKGYDDFMEQHRTVRLVGESYG